MSAELGADSDYSKGEMWIMTFEKLIAGIQPIDEKKRQAAMERCDQLVKPLGSLGKLESSGWNLRGSLPRD